jgi:hypothetical protein
MPIIPTTTSPSADQRQPRRFADVKSAIAPERVRLPMHGWSPFPGIGSRAGGGVAATLRWQT